MRGLDEHPIRAVLHGEVAPNPVPPQVEKAWSGSASWHRWPCPRASCRPGLRCSKAFPACFWMALQSAWRLLMLLFQPTPA